MLVVLFSSNVFAQDEYNYYCLNIEADIPNSHTKLLRLELLYDKDKLRKVILHDKRNPYKEFSTEVKKIKEEKVKSGHTNIKGEIPSDGYTVTVNFYEEYSMLRIGTPYMVGERYSCALETKYPQSEYVSLLTPSGRIKSWDINKAVEIGPMIYSIPQYSSNTNDRLEYLSFLSKKLAPYCFKKSEKKYKAEGLEYKDLKIRDDIKHEINLTIPYLVIYAIPYEKYRDVLYRYLLPDAPPLEPYMEMSNDAYYNFWCSYKDYNGKKIYISDMKNFSDFYDHHLENLIKENQVADTDKTLFIDFSKMRIGYKNKKGKIEYRGMVKNFYRQTVFLMDKLDLSRK